MKKFIRLFLLALVLSLPASSLKAHPHSWIDLETALLFDKQGRVTGLWVGWLFDDYYSAFTLENMKRGEDGNFNQTELNELAQTNLENLSEFNYFTFLRADEKTLPIKKVTDYKTHVEGFRLWMEFSVELEKPIDPKAHRFDYAVYDPTFYVEILHALEGDPIQIIGDSASACAYVLNKPEPPEELSLMAASLDTNETAGDGIGVYFAERVDIQCQ